MKDIIINSLKAIKIRLEIYRMGRSKIYYDTFVSSKLAAIDAKAKRPYRYDIINFLAKQINAQNYLEIGVRNPADNFNLINCVNKFSVDPGVEFELNPVDFQMTSDDFFQKLNEDALKIKSSIKFDVIFIDGLHLAEQVEKDISNAMQFLSEEGFIVLHDCNPPTEFHARENFEFNFTPAGGAWNGTTWKAFVKARKMYHSCCIDTDWGVGIVSKKERPLLNILGSNENIFFEYNDFSLKRQEQLNLISFDTFTKSFQS